MASRWSGVDEAPLCRCSTRRLLLLHGWPDDIRGWRQVAPRLHAAGYRTITPYLRGFGLTRFLSRETVRDGRGVALAHDAIDLADVLGIGTFAVVGHDWGARAAYTLAALFPDRVTSIAGIALAFQPGAKFHIPPFSQARRFWYQWLMALDQGADEVRKRSHRPLTCAYLVSGGPIYALATTELVTVPIDAALWLDDESALEY
jgi:pimeloyl-ACP methyl ester carboxylesterase